MERKKQTGHICRWMALGITIVTIVVGCTIAIGLFEWRDRNKLESRNAELHVWRKSMYDLNMHIAKMSLLGETAVDWDSAAASEYHTLSREVSKRLHDIAKLCSKEDIREMQCLLVEKERLLLGIRAAIHERNDIHSKFVAEVPKIVEKNKAENKKLMKASQNQPKKKKRNLLKRLFGKKEKNTDAPRQVKQSSNETAKMLITLQNDVLIRHQRQSRKVSGILDSLRIRNEVINRHLQHVITVVDAKVNNGIAKREQQIKSIESRNPYYYIGMLSSLIPIFIAMFFGVRKFAQRMRKSHDDMERLIAELQEANARNEELLQGRRKTLLTIVHELRSPLSSISNESAQIMRNGGEFSEEKVRDIQQSAKIMSEMIDSLLTFYRLDSGKETLIKKPVNLKSISETLRLEYAAQARQAGLAFEVHDHAEGVAIADKLKLLRIGRNLLSNAIKYSSSGTVMLRTEYINGRYTISVSDNGTGMTKEQTASIFKAFHRLGNAATKDGFGLGLSIVKSIVRLMGGNISVESEVGKGSIFTVRIPMDRADSPQDVTNCYQDIGMPGNYRIIAIDDSEAQLEIIHEAFVEIGISCDTCKNVNNLMQKIRENEYDLLITDLKMPEYDGYAILELLRTSNIRNSRSIPVLILTASDNITEEEFMSAGFCGCVFKPVLLKELREKVEGCIKSVKKERKMDFSKLVAYGNKDSLLRTIASETEEELVNVKTIASAEDREKMQDIVHHLYSSWGIVGADQPLRELSRLLKSATATDEEINKAVDDVIRQAEAIINGATKQLERND